nr:uncharacterized protein LOC109423220 [Aedes albopictus]
MIPECVEYVLPPPRPQNLFHELKPHIGKTFQASQRLEPPNVKATVKSLSKPPVKSSDYKASVRNILKQFEADLDATIVSTRKFLNSTRIKLMFDLKNNIQNEYDRSSNMMRNSFIATGVCQKKNLDCWNRAKAALPKFEDGLNHDAKVCDDIFGAQIAAHRDESVKVQTIRRVVKELDELKTKCLEHSRDNSYVRACLGRSVTRSLLRSVAYFKSLNNAVEQEINLRKYLNNLTSQCFADAYQSRKPLFEHGIKRLQKCIENVSNKSENHDADME